MSLAGCLALTMTGCQSEKKQDATQASSEQTTDSIAKSVDKTMPIAQQIEDQKMNQQSTHFHAANDVLAYLNKHHFGTKDNQVLTFNQQGDLSLNGKPFATNAKVMDVQDQMADLILETAGKKQIHLTVLTPDNNHVVVYNDKDITFFEIH